MIVIDNILEQKGDAVEFQTVPLFNIQSLLNYEDDVVGVVANTRELKKTFCYSFDGIVFTEYVDLTEDNLLLINTKLNSTNGFLILRFNYERTGPSNTGQIKINELIVNGVYRSSIPNFETSGRTPFADLVYDNVDVWNLAFNLAQKMYEDGIIPAYILRREESNNIETDKDFIDFWEIVGKLFGIVLIDAFKFTVIYWRKELLCEYLKQKGIIVCDCEDIVTLQLIAQHFFDEMRQRGTYQIFRPKDYEYPLGSRTVYASPYQADDYIRPSLPVSIDGIEYREIDELPEGWLWLKGEDIGNTNGILASPDMNYHDVKFFDYNNKIFIASQEKGVLYASIKTGVRKKYDGEFLRLICWKPEDEFIFNIPERKHTGWCLGHSSPMYRGLRPQYNTNIVKVYHSWQ